MAAGREAARLSLGGVQDLAVSPDGLVAAAVLHGKGAGAVVWDV